VPAILAGCGYVGNPLPPTLDIPNRVIDLRAIQIGDRIYVEFTQPKDTTDGLTLKSLRAVEVVVGPNPSPFSDSAWLAGSKSFPVTGAEPGAVKDEIPVASFIGREVLIRVRATGPKGKNSDWSNNEFLAVIKPLERPTAVTPENVREGVAISWHGSGPKYRIYRAVGDGAPEKLTDIEAPRYVDTTTQYGTDYRYYVQAFAGEKQQSEVSDARPITPKDIFAPAVPANPTAIASVKSIELAWERNTESDFRGYNIFRALEGGAFEKIASLVEAPTYSDTKIEAGKKYRYAISAVDLTGNESGRSQIAEATAPGTP
jgi:hypothetical protein